MHGPPIEGGGRATKGGQGGAEDLARQRGRGAPPEAPPPPRMGTRACWRAGAGPRRLGRREDSISPEHAMPPRRSGPVTHPSPGTPSPSPSHVPSGDRLPRRLGAWSAGAVLVGTTIGSGIFRVPSTAAAEVGTAGALALVWIAGAVVVVCGALTLSELSAMLPESGGCTCICARASARCRRSCTAGRIWCSPTPRPTAPSRSSSPATWEPSCPSRTSESGRWRPPRSWGCRWRTSARSAGARDSRTRPRRPRSWACSDWRGSCSPSAAGPGAAPCRPRRASRPRRGAASAWP